MALQWNDHNERRCLALEGRRCSNPVVGGVMSSAQVVIPTRYRLGFKPHLQSPVPRVRIADGGEGRQNGCEPTVTWKCGK